MPGKKLHAQTAFTLIELLVVVGIIALLVSILLPSLARSREQARSVACRSNLKQLGNAMAMYADAYKGTLPFEDRGQEASHGRICWFDALDRQLGASQADEDVKTCPTVQRADPGREESYRMNSKLADTSETKKDGTENPYYKAYRKLGTLNRPAETVVLFDGDVGGDTVSFKGRWRLTNDDVNYRHNVATNLLFADWHVDNVKKNVLMTKSIKNDAIIWQPADMGAWDPDPEPK